MELITRSSCHRPHPSPQPSSRRRALITGQTAGPSAGVEGLILSPACKASRPLVVDFSDPAWPAGRELWTRAPHRDRVDSAQKGARKTKQKKRIPSRTKNRDSVWTVKGIRGGIPNNVQQIIVRLRKIVYIRRSDLWAANGSDGKSAGRIPPESRQSLWFMD